MNVTDEKTKDGTLFTVTLSPEELAAVALGQTEQMVDPETKFVFAVKQTSPPAYVIEAGPDLAAVLRRALAGWLVNDRMVLAGDSGTITLKEIPVGAKSSRGNTFAAYDGELAP